MSRSFGSYSPVVPMNVTWEESIILEDSLGDPVNLAGYDVRTQFYLERPLRTPITGVPVVLPVAEVTTEDYYITPPVWPVFEGATIATPADGKITLAVTTTQLWTFSPTNEKVKLFWAIILVNKTTGYAIPVVEGRVTFKPTNTL